MDKNSLYILIFLSFTSVTAPTLFIKISGVSYWPPFPYYIFGLWTGYLFSGYFLSYYRSFISSKIKFMASIFIVTIIIVSLLNYKYIQSGMMFSQYEDIGNIILSVSLFSIMVVFGDKFKEYTYINKIVLIISPLSFGIYLSHYPVLVLVRSVYPTTNINGALVQIVLTLGICIVISNFMHKTPSLKPLITI